MSLAELESGLHERDGRVVLTGGRVFDSMVGTFSPPMSVVCAGDKVIGLEGYSFASAPGDVVIDVAGRFVLPGLIDAHFHTVSRSAEQVDDEMVGLGSVEGVVNAAERLEAGVTAVRDAGCRHWGIHSLRAAIEADLIRGPRIYAAGRNPTGAKAPAHWRNVVVKGPAAMRAAVDAELDAGASWVKLVISHAEDPAAWDKVTMYLDEEEVRAAVDAAHRRGVRLGAHVEGFEAAKIAVACGVDVLDHSPLIDDATALSMGQKGISYVPTLWAFSGDAGVDDGALAAGKVSELHRWRAEHQSSVRRAMSAGVVIAAGSDAAGTLPARDVLICELEGLVSAGLSQAQAVQCATYGAARVLGEEDSIGTVRPGKAADLLVVESDPTVDVRSLRQVALVVSRGRIVAGSLAERLSLTQPPALEKARAALAGAVNRWGSNEGPLVDADSRLQAVADDLRQQTKASRATVRLCAEDGSVEIVAESLADGARSMRVGPQPAVREAPTYIFLERERRILVQDDCRAAEHAPPPTLISVYGVLAQMLAPVVVDDRLVATISVHQQGRTRVWSKDDVAALAGAQIAIRSLLTGNEGLRNGR